MENSPQNDIFYSLKRILRLESLLKGTSRQTVVALNNSSTLKSWDGTQEEYDALSAYDSHTTYYIHE